MVYQTSVSRQVTDVLGDDYWWDYCYNHLDMRLMKKTKLWGYTYWGKKIGAIDNQYGLWVDDKEVAEILDKNGIKVTLC